MKWLIIQSDGEHKGQDGWTPNWHFRECYAIKHALRCNNIDSDIWGLRHDNFLNVPDFNSYDVILCLENYEVSWLPKFEDIKPLKMQWIIDLHCNPPEVYDKITYGVDVILHSTKCLIPLYQNRHPNKKHIWFPNGVDDRYFIRRDFEKSTGISFVGSKNPSRKEMIERLESEIGLKYFFATGEDMIRLVSSCKIHFNKNIGIDMNYRIFETIGLGTALVTNRDDTLFEMGFVDNENVILYDSYDEVKNKILDSLQSNSWVSIAEKGFELSKKHSYTKRISDILDKI